MTCVKLPLKGACMCAAVQVRVDAMPLLTVACHCGGCQKFSASAYSLTAMVPKESFHIEGKLNRGGLGTEGRAHYFCASCKNFVYSQLASAPDRVNLRISILQERAAFAPFVEVMTDEKLPWAQLPVTHSYATAPTSLDELKALMADYAKSTSR